MSTEEKYSAEALKRMVKRGGVENRNERGYTSTDDDLLGINNYVDGKLRDRGWGDFSKSKNQQMVTLPLSSIPAEILRKARIQEAGTEVAVCWNYYGLLIDKHSRNGVFRGIAVMSASDAESFQQEVQHDPRVLMSLARAINNGPIKRCDGTPANIQTGEAVTIMANETIGGKLTKSTTSAPFPQGFIPNPLF